METEADTTSLGAMGERAIGEESALKIVLP